MSLILLFLPTGGNPINTETLGPAVVHAIEIIRPTLLSVERATGEFTDSTVTYSSSTVTYSSSTELYGGSDASRVVVDGGQLNSIDQATPVLYDVTKL
jgi:hypothetical protein